MRMSGWMAALAVVMALLFNSGSAQATAACGAIWHKATVYTAGMKVSQYGVNYTANYWTQGDDPMTHNGNGGPWTISSICHACEVAPAVPTGLTAVATSDLWTDLIWSTSAVPANCTVSGYKVYKNNVLVATTTGNNAPIYGLTASTAYNLSVRAIDSVGMSAASKVLRIRTLASGQNRGPTPVFAPYIDMSQAVSGNLPQIQKATGINHFTLAFVLSPGDCSAAWGGVGSIDNDTMPNGKTILSLVTAVRRRGGDVIISFGGAAGQEPALVCTTVASLQAVYQHVINRYRATSIDFDIEGGTLTNTASLTLRDKALVGIRAANPKLTISYTLPVNPTGLDSNGIAVLNKAKADGFDPDVINIMAMDYGSNVDNGGKMGMDAILAANNTALQIAAAKLTSRVGVTPMIGVNDVATEIFSPADATQLLQFSHPNPDIARLAMWSVNRDNGSCAGAKSASATCSGLAQKPYAFGKIFKEFEQPE